MKKLCFLTLALALLLCACTPSAVAATDQTAAPKTESNQPFSDVPGNAYYAEAVQWAVAQGVTVGTGENTFSPNTVCTRAQIVTFLWRAAGSPTSEAAAIRFSDVSGDAYYADAVRWAVESGVTVGTGADKFSPGASCTRAQIVTFLYRNADSAAVGDSALDVPFTDVPADAYYADAVQWAIARGITKGTGSNTFSPDKPCTSAEAVTFIYRNVKAEDTPETPETPQQGSRILVAYFSATGNTAPLAETIAKLLGADLYEIVPAEPYTEADLAYYTGGRCDQEQADPDCRPAIDGQVEHMAQYDTVVIGHPIWHGQAPRIISTFLESYDFSGKTLTTFCTSMSSPLGTSAENLHGLVPEDVTWLESRRFPAGASETELTAWLKEIGLLKESTEELTEEPMIQLTIAGTPVEVAWAENSTVDALKELLAKVGPITLDMSDYAGFEKGAPLPETLPQNNEPMNTDAGDIILYQGRQFVIYYDQNSWSLTPLGKITNLSKAELQDLLGAGNVTAVLSLSNP